MGGITVSGGRRGIQGQSCLAPAQSTMREAKLSSGRDGPWAQCVSEPIDEFSKQTRLLEHTEFLRGRTAEPGSPLGKADTTQWLSEAALTRPKALVGPEEPLPNTTPSGQ